MKVHYLLPALEAFKLTFLLFGYHRFSCYFLLVLLAKISEVLLHMATLWELFGFSFIGTCVVLMLPLCLSISTFLHLNIIMNLIGSLISAAAPTLIDWGMKKIGKTNIGRGVGNVANRVRNAIGS